MNLLSKINKFINNNKKLNNYIITFLIIFTIFFLFNNIHIYEGLNDNLIDEFTGDNTLPNNTQKNQRKTLENYLSQANDLKKRNIIRKNNINDTNLKNNFIFENARFEKASIIEPFESSACENKCNGSLSQLGSYNNNSNTANKLCQAMNLQKCQLESKNTTLINN